MLKFRELDDKKKKMIILITTLILFIGVSFAFIAAQLSGGAIGNANVTADTTDNLQFNVDKDIYLNPTQFNVVEGGGGLSDTAVGTASLIANSTNNEASATYNVYFRINTNEYIYTTEDNKPEIVLTIIDPTGQLVTSLEGLTYVTAQNADGTTVSGFDITTEMGLFTIASDYAITSSSSTVATEQDWTFTVTFINLTTNQTENSGSTLDAEIILGTEKRYTLANYIIDSVYVEDGVNGLYYHDGAGTYTNADQEAGDNSYRYSGGNYTIADEYKGEYTDINNLLINLNTTVAYIYKNRAYSTADENELNKVLQAVYEDFAIEYCSINACDYEELLNQILSGTVEDENITNAGNEYLINLQTNGDFIVAQPGAILNYNGEILFGEYNIYKCLVNEFCDINSCDADLVYNDFVNEVENELTIEFTTYIEESNIYEQSTMLNYLLAYDASVAFETYNDAGNYAVNDGVLLSLNNYVCFGSDADICPEENLYRIIGVFDGEVKVIKADYTTSELLGTNGDYYGVYSFDTSYYKGSVTSGNVASYYWNVNGTNTWSESRLNTENLNVNYLNNIESTWTSKITTHTWQVGGATYPNIANSPVQTAYNYEVGANSANVTYSAKIGLMYMSDFGYAASPTNWITNMGSLNTATNTDNNWMFMGLIEWTISRLDDMGYVFNVYYTGYAHVSYVLNYRSVRPVFYLKSSVELAGGTGSSTDPYRLVV